MKPVRERERACVWTCERRKCREKIAREKAWPRGEMEERRTEESKGLACNNVPGKSIPLIDQENRKPGGVSVPRSTRGEETQTESLCKKKRAGGALPELFVPVTSRVYFNATQLYNHLYGDGVVCVFCDVYVSRSLRGTHILVSSLNEEKKEKRERKE